VDFLGRYRASDLKMEAVYSSETTSTYKSTRHYNPKEQHRHTFTSLSAVDNVTCKVVLATSINNVRMKKINEIFMTESSVWREIHAQFLSVQKSSEDAHRLFKPSILHSCTCKTFGVKWTEALAVTGYRMFLI
jgi:hypothetical protein